MDFRLDGQAAYVLHARPYRDTSLLTDCFTLEYGKVSLVVRGARRPGSRLRAAMQPFVPLQLSWQGRQELKTLSLAEPVAPPLFLTGRALLCGLYVNELLQRLLQPLDPHPRLYVYYQYVLNELVSGEDIEGALRTFERQLLSEAGFAPDLGGLEPSRVYLLDRDGCLVPVSQVAAGAAPRCFHGWQLQAVAQDDYRDPAVRRAAKRLMRLLIDRLLEGRALRSRDLFQKTRPAPGPASDVS
ncbi:DNA repair protein RecO [Marinobacterium nitratireducens]|uniref:DNA repair protein RecO n=1 Tax=Marinobacterium nitratireducens TaxID=518897 RepID=A0A917ZH68_9GAMM|nr:DNA repair protein RecO [Marinobacterium nitratireducens]GGO82432.1 DNA repair protein RecO [Marinobacterium nitratireducens]